MLGQESVSFVRVPSNSSAIQRGPAIVFQRTTNRSQSRRLIGGLIAQPVIDKYGGYVTENHTIVVAADPSKPQLIGLEILLSILNSPAVDRAYRRLSGTVSVSTRVLQHLSLPNANRILELLDSGLSVDDAVERAYQMDG